MLTRFLTLLVLVGASFGAAHTATAQDVDPQQAAACSQAVDGQNWEQVRAVCPAVLAQLPEDHPYYASWTQSVAYANGLACPGAGEAERWDEVIATCEPLLQSTPGAFIANYFLGRAYFTRQDWERAAVNFSAFLDGARGNADAAPLVAVAERFGGLAYFQASAMEDAIPLLRAAASANSDDFQVQRRLGQALLATGDSAGAERALSAFLDSAPDPAPGFLFLAGQLSFNAGDLAKADERLSAFVSADPNARGIENAHLMLGQALQGSDEDRAVTHYLAYLDRAGADHDQRANASYSLGTIYYNRDDCSNAETHYKQFMELAPDHANAAQVTEILASIAEGGCQS